MADKTTIPFQSLSEMLTDMSIEWHSSDYYISPGITLHRPASYSPFRPDFYGLILCTDGWLDIKINGIPVRIDRWSFFASGPEMFYQRSLQSPGCATRALFFTKEFLLKNVVNPRQFDSFDFFSNNSNSVLQLTEDDIGPLMQLYDVLKEKRTPANSSYQLEVIRNVVFAYVYEAATIYEKKGGVLPKQLGREADLAWQFQQLLSQHCTTQHNLKFYADSLYISSKYLIHAIKRSTKKTPGTLIDEAIIDIAKQRLQDPTRSISEISDELQFSDQAAFNKFFKRHIGHSPSKFRKGS